MCERQVAPEKNAAGGSLYGEMRDMVVYGQCKSCEFFQMPIEKESQASQKIKLHNYKVGLDVSKHNKSTKLWLSSHYNGE